MRSLEEDSREVTKLLKGRKVKTVVLNKRTEVLIEFQDGARLFIDVNKEALELSVTGID